MRANFCCISVRTLSVALPSIALPDDGKFLRWGDSAGAVPCGRQEAAQADQGNGRRPPRTLSFSLRVPEELPAVLAGLAGSWQRFEQGYGALSGLGCLGVGRGGQHGL